MVLHAFAILASARGLCLARRLYTSSYLNSSYEIVKMIDHRSQEGNAYRTELDSSFEGSQR